MRCDRCGRPLEAQDPTYGLAVELTRSGVGLRDERKVAGQVCPECFRLIERRVTEVLKVASWFPPSGEYAEKGSPR